MILDQESVLFASLYSMYEKNLCDLFNPLRVRAEVEEAKQKSKEEDDVSAAICCMGAV